MIGNVYGRLIVVASAISYVYGRSHRARWECVCECGNKSTYSGTHLRTGRRTQCVPCAYKARPQSALRLDPYTRMYNLAVVGRCKKKGIENNLSVIDYIELAKQNCYYCDQTAPLKNAWRGVPIHVKTLPVKANGIDRVDSCKGYSKENCVPCCYKCNTMKARLSVKDFIEHIKQILHVLGER